MLFINDEENSYVFCVVVVYSSFFNVCYYDFALDL